ncbi:MAG: FKBP-type peptidyl-prolyl cis-trans isomerase [Cytophagales bacterium]|nr:FKBP-type peptidyl-prolyl cis-trans isomerase [Cytophagales bacterium]
MKKIIITLSLALIYTLVGYSQTKPQSKPKPMTEFVLKTQADKLSYAIGINIAQGMKQQGLSDSLNIKALARALEDVFKGGKMALSTEDAQGIIQNFMMAQQQKMQAEQQKSGGKNLEEGKKFLAENKTKPGVVTLPSGLQYMVLKEGTGPIPVDTNTVTTHYHGTLINGEVFDSSVQRGQPASFPVNGVIKGWIEALKLMKVGSKWKLFVPSDLAYGPQSAGPKIGPNSTLIFEVELISIDK